MSLRLVPNSMTLDNLERRNKLIALTAAYNFTEFGSFAPLRAHYVKEVEDTLRLSVAEYLLRYSRRLPRRLPCIMHGRLHRGRDFWGKHFVCCFHMKMIFVCSLVS